jgi:hypothetical protein
MALRPMLSLMATSHDSWCPIQCGATTELCETDLGVVAASGVSVCLSQTSGHVLRAGVAL